MVLVVRLEAHPAEAGDHSLKLHLLTRTAATACPPSRAPSRPAIRRSRASPIRTAPLILQMHGVRFDTPGHYSFELLVDNHHLRSLPLHVLADAKAKDVEVEAWHDAA